MVKWLDHEGANKAANNGNIPGLGDWSAAQSTTPQDVIDYGYYQAVDQDGRVALGVTIPPNTTAAIWVPTSGQKVAAPPNVTFARSTSFDGIQYGVYDAGPGTYQFNH